MPKTMDVIPDPILSDQFFPTLNPNTGERRLLQAVLHNAIMEFQRYAGAEGRKEKRLFREAQEWINEEGSLHLYSFEIICSILHLDPGYIRAGLRRWLGQKGLICPSCKCSSVKVTKKIFADLPVHRCLQCQTTFTPRLEEIYGEIVRKEGKK